jgi:hypothetical protein
MMKNIELINILKKYPDNYNIEINFKGNSTVHDGMGKDVYTVSASEDDSYPDWIYLVANMEE